MSATLEFLKEAKADAEDAARYYERQVPGLGTRFQTEFEQVCAGILRNPLLWRERSGGHRRVNLPGFPYYIAYFLRGERVLVVAVGHASRQEDFWQSREFQDRPDV